MLPWLKSKLLFVISSPSKKEPIAFDRLLFSKIWIASDPNLPISRSTPTSLELDHR